MLEFFSFSFWLDFQKSPSSDFICRGRKISRDFVARGRPLRGQTMLAPLAKRSTCSKSTFWFAWIFLSVLACIKCFCFSHPSPSFNYFNCPFLHVHDQKSRTSNFARLTFILFRNGFYSDSRAHNVRKVRVVKYIVFYGQIKAADPKYCHNQKWRRKLKEISFRTRGFRDNLDDFWPRYCRAKVFDLSRVLEAYL